MTRASLLRGRVLRIHLLALAAIAVCLLAANWQWGRAHSVRTSAERTVEFSVASPLRAYLPVASIGRTTSVSGQWVPGFRLVVPRASADGPTVLAGAAIGHCPWVVDALRLADGSALAVVRGCGVDAPRAEGSARVTGTLQPSEDADVVGFTADSITTTDIARQVGGVVHDGYLVADAAPSGLNTVTPLLPDPLMVPLHWRNVVYVGNWLIFAAIIGYMWRRVVADEMRDTETPVEGP